MASSRQYQSVNFCSDLGVHEDLSAASSAWLHKDLNTACVVSGIRIQYCNFFVVYKMPRMHQIKSKIISILIKIDLQNQR